MQFAAAHGDFVTPAVVAIAEGDYERNLANTVELFHLLLHDPKEAKHQSNYGFGLNARTGQFEDLQAAGILDPCKVTAASLRNTASVAKLVLATRTLIADKPESYDPTSAPCRWGGAERFGMDYQSAEVVQ